MRHYFRRDERDRWAFSVRLGCVKLRTVRYMVPVEKLRSPFGGIRSWQFEVTAGQAQLYVKWR